MQFATNLPDWTSDEWYMPAYPFNPLPVWAWQLLLHYVSQTMETECYNCSVYLLSSPEAGEMECTHRHQHQAEKSINMVISVANGQLSPQYLFARTDHKAVFITWQRSDFKHKLCSNYNLQQVRKLKASK